MLCLHYQDERERALAVASIGRRCWPLDARLVFVGPEAACETTRAALSRIESTARSCVTFRPLSCGKNGFDTDGYRAALLEVFAASGAAVAWVEAPAVRNGVATAAALRVYHNALEALAAGIPTTVISAFRLAQISERALLGLAAGSSALISAKMVLPHCPSWLISRTRTDITPVAGIPPSPSPPPATSADPISTSLLQVEKLATLGQFAAGMAHELGNPLSVISSSLQYLHQRLAAAGDPASEFTMTALQNVERMHGLLRSMLDFAVVKKLRFERIQLKEAVSEILGFTSGECARRGIAVDSSIDPALPPVWVDSCCLKQILLNLVKNALDALLCAGETLRIHIGMRPVERLVAVEVENNGPPIPAEALPSLFRPFYTTKDGGTGLGLYLSRQIARDLGGDLTAGNLIDGVRFTLTLPLDGRKGDNHGARPDRRRRAGSL